MGAVLPFIDIQKLRELAADERIIAFAGFINTNADGKAFPDYETMNLMDIAALVSHVCVIKVTPMNGKRLLFHFSGTAFDDLYEKNTQGLYLEDFYTGDNKETVIANNNAIIDERRTYYFVNTARFRQPSYEKRRKIIRLGVPCSSDGETINYTISLVYFDLFSQGDHDQLVGL